MRKKIIPNLLGFVLLFSLIPTSVFGQSNYDKVQIKTIPAAENIYMLKGSGGNIGVCVGEDGAFMIDDQFAPLTQKIKAAIRKISSTEIRFLINTHWHFDHVGGNENIGEMGTVIIAHDNVRKRMSTDQFIDFFQKNVPAAPHAALPVITFSKNLTFHLNNETIDVFHVSKAHTDGDAVIYFKNTNVIHTGDIYFAGIYPFIDTSAHGSINGMIAAAKSIHKIINNETKVIPGHGPLSNKAELTEYISMLEGVRDAVTPLVKAGKSLQETITARPTQKFDEKWGNGFLKPNHFVEIVYNDLTGKH